MTRRSSLLKDVLWVVALSGAVAILFRLWFGLGPTTNLTDAVPWGLWKILNMVAGVALATGGFTVGLLVYVLRIGRLRPLVKPAVLIAFLGYGSSVFALFLDIGLPHRIWHPFIMWNPHSFLFEVAMCVATYFTLTAVELAPTILERFRHWQSIAHALHRAAPALVILGITLSSLHHTSLGSLFLVTPLRLHPLWYSSWLPLLFITSAMGAGMMVTVLVVLTWQRLYRRSEPARPHLCVTTPGEPVSSTADQFDRLRLLASVASGVLAAFAVLKVIDLGRTGAWHTLVAGSWESWLCLIEIVLLGVVPVVLMLHKRARRSTEGMASAAASATLGLVLNRLNVGIFGYFRDADTVYVPSLTEWLIGAGIVAAAGLVLLELGERFPIFDDGWRQRESARHRFQPVFDDLSRVWRPALGDRTTRVSLLAVLLLPLVWALLYPPFTTDGSPLHRDVRPPLALDTTRAVLRIDGNLDSFGVTFPHEDHRKRLGGEQSCVRCHHLALPRDNATPCSRCHRSMRTGTDIFDHGAHLAEVAEKEKLTGSLPENRSCPLCHLAGQPESALAVKPCLECHRTDMRPSSMFEAPKDLQHVPAYRAAFHGHCAECHRQEAELRQRPELGECRNCHPSATAPARRPTLQLASLTP